MPGNRKRLFRLFQIRVWITGRHGRRPCRPVPGGRCGAPDKGHVSGHGPVTRQAGVIRQGQTPHNPGTSAALPPAWKCLPKRIRMTGKGTACRVLPGLPHPFKEPHGSGRRFFPISPTACASFRYGILCGGFPAHRKHGGLSNTLLCAVIAALLYPPVGHPAQESVAAERECRQKACFIFDNKIQNQ